MIRLWHRFKSISPRKKARLFSTITMIYNFVSGGLKIFFGLISSYFFAVISGAYVLCIGMGKRIYFHGRAKSGGVLRKEIKYYRQIGIIIFTGAICYIIAMLRYVSFLEELKRYDVLTSIALCVISFVEITLAVSGIIRARKDKDLLMEGLKFINVITSLVALITTEAVLLTWLRIGNASYVNGASGILIGLVSAGIGVTLFTKANYLDKKFAPKIIYASNHKK